MAYFRCEKSTKIIKNLLWTNSSPTTAFNPQTLSLDLSKYDGIVIYQKNLTTVTPNLDNTSQNYIPKDGITRYIASPYAGNDLRRQVTVTNTGITFGNGINGASTTQNTVTIPLEIYGYVYEPDMGEVRGIIQNSTSSAITVNLGFQPRKLLVYTESSAGVVRDFMFYDNEKPNVIYRAIATSSATPPTVVLPNTTDNVVQQITNTGFVMGKTTNTSVNYQIEYIAFR